MNPTSEGRYRVLAVDGADLLLVDATPDPETAAADAYDPVSARLEEGVAAAGDDPGLEPGNLVTATLAWPDDGPATVTDLAVDRRTRIWVGIGVGGMFEAAEETWANARAAGEAMRSRVTRGTDSEPNGALYVFADGPDRDAIEAFRSGAMPLEPLLARANAGRDDDADRAVFLLRPAGGDYVAVYVAFERDGLLARTVRDTYDLE